MARESNSSSKKASAPQPRPRKRKPASLRHAAALAALFALIIGAGPQTARAVVTAPPQATAAPAPAASLNPNASILPLDSSLFFVLDDPISSRERANSTARAHLRDPIMLGGSTIAPSGTPVEIRVAQTQGAQMGNVDGSVDIFFGSLKLPSGQILPLLTPTSHIDAHLSSGQSSTRGITDTAGDVFVPGYLIYSVLRRGMDVNLYRGTVIRARTAAALRLSGTTVAVETPPPFPPPAETPHALFTPAPFIPAPGAKTPTPNPSPS